MQLLIHDRANVDVVAENGETLLHAAAASQDFEEITQLLIDHNARIEALNNKCETPLYVAASKGHAKVVELLLLEAGVQVTPSVLRGKTALYAAAHAGHKAIVRAYSSLGHLGRVHLDGGWILDVCYQCSIETPSGED